MILWRLSGREHAARFDGGYGLLYDGRWNSVGHAVTYCATSPALCVLENLVHIQDPDLLPDLVMVRYRVPDELEHGHISGGIAVCEGRIEVDPFTLSEITHRIRLSGTICVELDAARVPAVFVDFGTGGDHFVDR